MLEIFCVLTCLVSFFFLIPPPYPPPVTYLVILFFLKAVYRSSCCKQNLFHGLCFSYSPGHFSSPVVNPFYCDWFLLSDYTILLLLSAFTYHQAFFPVFFSSYFLLTCWSISFCQIFFSCLCILPSAWFLPFLPYALLLFMVFLYCQGSLLQLLSSIFSTNKHTKLSWWASWWLTWLFPQTF